MDEAVSHENGLPVFFKTDVAFSSLVVERLKIQGKTDDKHYTVYYAGTGRVYYFPSSKSIAVSNFILYLMLLIVDGKVYKVVQWFDEVTQQGKSELLDIFEVTTPEPIRMMEISPKVCMKFL